MAFAPVFQRPFSGTFDRHAAAAAAAAWYVVAGKTCVAAYQPKGAASLAASYTNLANPGTYDAAPGTAPTWDATGGWTFAVAGMQYLKTGITVSVGTWSALCRFADIGTGPNYLIAADTTFAKIVLAPKSVDVGNANLWANGGYYFASPGSTSGVMAVAGTANYLDGAPIGSRTGSWSGTSIEHYIGARNNAGSPAGYLNGKIQAIAIYSATLTAGEVATVSAAMAAL